MALPFLRQIETGRHASHFPKPNLAASARFHKALHFVVLLAHYGFMPGRSQEINSLSGKAMVFLSLLAPLAVLSGYTQPPQTDEGTGAHIFQLSIVALAPAILLFLAMADWKQPLRSVRPLVISAAALVLAFGALYYLEHYRDPHYGPHGQTAPAARPSLSASIARLSSISKAS